MPETHRAHTPARPEANAPPREDDPHATPLGRGANPGTSVENGPLRRGSITGPRGHNAPRERGGPSGILDRENEDATPDARHDPQGLKG